MTHLKKSLGVTPLLLLLTWTALPGANPRSQASGGKSTTKHLDANAAAFVRPGIKVKVTSAAIAKDGTITARFTIADPKGMPLDREGLQTPGAVNIRLIAGYVPAGGTAYRTYTTTTLASTLNKNPSQVQAGTDSGGTFAVNSLGDYTYTFKTKAPAGWDATLAHVIGISAQRDLTEFMSYAEWAETANDVYNFMPDGSAVKSTRSIVSTAACNQCHNPLFGHGGSRLTVEMCILCHTPQTINPDTTLTQDMPVLIHKIHMGKNLPSVKAGTPYRIWHRGAWSDFSEVSFPQNLRNCVSCHKDAPQADNWKNKPTRAACGACHDNVNFATGENHANLPQASDNQCGTCHGATATQDLDLSVPGAHAILTQSASLPGIKLEIRSVENATPGNSPIVSFKVTNKKGEPVDISKLTQIRVLLAGPNVDYQTGPGAIRVSENPAATPGTDGLYRYTMTNKVPAAATGSYTVSMEARNTVTLLANTTKQTTATDSAIPVRTYFSVDGSKVVARRAVVSDDKCKACHQTLTFIHGGTRAAVQECALCHNPSLVDGTSKQSVNFAWFIHSIHKGEELANPYVLGTTNYQEVRFPGDVRDCSSCHLAGTYNPENVGAKAAVASTGSFTPTTPPITAACLGCHDTARTASHALANTTTLGESCVVCHSATANHSMDRAHSRTQ